MPLILFLILLLFCYCVQIKYKQNTLLPAAVQVNSFQARSHDFCKGGHDDGGTEDPERGAEAEAPKRRGGGV